MRLCVTCRLALPRSAFARDPQRADGLARECKACAQAREILRQHDTDFGELRGTLSFTKRLWREKGYDE
jgi:hypothetical protein